METAGKDSSGRVIFLDNLRYLFVLCVVLQHASNAYYGNLPTMGWWPVVDSGSCTALGLLCATLNLFTMPLLFFIAGYFALPTIKRHGTFSFVQGKLKRLGIPWMVCTLTICPILPLVYHYTRNGLTLSQGYFDLWVTLIKSFLRFNVGVIPSMNQLMMNNGFYQRYMWFISLLLLFFIIFSLLYGVKKGWFDTAACSAGPKSPSIPSSLKLLGAVGGISLVGFMLGGVPVLLAGHKNPMSWFSLANVIQFQPISLPVFLIYFGLGVLMCRNRWVERGKFPGHTPTWLISTGILLILYVFFLRAFLTAPSGSDAQDLYGFLTVPVSSLLTMAFLGSFSSLAIRYWNRPTRMDRNLASNSYNIYLSHYIFVLVLQLILFVIPGIPVLLKFAIVAVASMVLAYLVSQFLIRPFPKLTVALLSLMLLVMFVVIRA
jgi:hypothetical protein